MAAVSCAGTGIVSKIKVGQIRENRRDKGTFK
jgi:hypothetical protein